MADVVLQGIFVGGLYALIALGFVIVYKSSQVVNLAYGEMLLLLVYFLYFLTATVDLPVWLAVLVLFLSGAAMGYVVERFTIRRLVGKSFLSVLMMTLMLGFLFRSVTTIIWGTRSFILPFTPSGMLEFGGVQIVPSTLWAFLAGLLFFLLLFLLFRYTKVGLSMRVVAADYRVARSMGIRVRHILSLSWVMSGIFAAVCAILVGMVFMVTPITGQIGLGKGLPVLLLGGLNSIPGALIGGIIVGLVESLGGYWAGEFREIVPWILMLVILLFRPWGMFGERRIERI